jgi:hypothetical protein
MSLWILEDNEERRIAMQSCLDKRFPKLNVHFSIAADQFIEIAGKGLEEGDVVSLDHDLEDVITEDGGRIDAGTGRHAADFLATREPTGPVMVHSTNVPAAIGMEMALSEAGWITHRITPFNDIEWIHSIWIDTLNDMLNEKN